MKEFWQKLKEWWASLTLRDKRIILIGGILASSAIIYLWIWLPVLEKVESQRKRIEADATLLVWMQAADKEIKKLESRGTKKTAALSPVSFLSYVQTKIKEVDLSQSLTQLRQVSNETIAMRFQKVDFDQAIRLLIAIVKEQNVSIVQLSAVAEKISGTATIDVVIKL